MTSIPDAEAGVRARVYGIFATLVLRAPTEDEQPKVVEMLEHVAAAVGETLDGARLAASDVRDEFERLFLIPLPSQGISLYGGTYRGDSKEAWGDVSFRLAALAAACGVTWQTGEYGPDRAYLIDPDHLGFMLTLLADVLERQAEGRREPLADEEPEAWIAWLRRDLMRWLPALQQRARDQAWATFYPDVLDLLAAYLATDQDLGVQA